MTETRAPAFTAMCIISTTLALTIVSLRIGYRYSKKNLMVADYMIMIAMFFSLVHFALDMTLVFNFGYGRHEKDLPPELRNSYKTKIIYWVIQIVTKPPLLFAKLSLCLLYKNLLSTANHLIVRISRVLNYITMVVIVCFFTAVTLTTVFGCVPIKKNWYTHTPGTCINNLVTVNYVTSTVNVVTSLLLIYIPLPILFRVRARRIEIRQLIALILLGLIDAVISMVRAWSISLFWDLQTDFTWIVIPTHTIIVCEYNITIIAASLVVMQTCFQAIHRKLFPNIAHGTQRSAHGTDGRDLEQPGTIQSFCNSNSFVKHNKDAGIRVTLDVELDSRSASKESILHAQNRF